MISIVHIIQDYYFQLKGKFINNNPKDYKFAFLVHSRNYKDIYRKYHFARFLPKSIVLFIMEYLWPITLSRVTGVVSYEHKHNIDGYVLGITMTAEQMLNNRKKALRKIRSAVYLAKGRGVSIVGLGGLTSSLSKGGLDLVDIPINITTGHAYTAFNVCENLFKMVEIFNIPEKSLNIAVVGAAGSVGSTSSLIISRHNFKSITLIDLKRKQSAIEELSKKIREINSNIEIKVSDTVKDIKYCDFIITATNTNEALITSDLVEGGMVFIDDAQPSDIHPDVLKMENVLVLEAGVVHTPNINSNFNYGLKNRTDNFCCMAELLVLASHKWDKHYVINRATLDHVDEISNMGKRLGFTIATFQNFMESITHDKIEVVKKIARNKHGV
jgi:predicted amino acid dehydrogenase